VRNWLRGPAPAADRPAVAPWFAATADALADLFSDPSPRTIYCIANSDAVPVDAVRARLDPARDLLCQYNLCRHAAAFAAPDLASIFLFHMTDRAGQIHGIANDGTPCTDLRAFGPGSRAGFLRSGYGSDHAPPAIGLPAFTLETDRLQALFYDARPGVIPSAGFASALLFHLVNLRRALDGRPPHAIVLCGFTGQYTGGAFLGHDFRFEQAELAKLPHVTRLGAEPAGPTPPSRLHRELAEVFHPGYNGHKRTKADMLFDVAKLHFAAGDLAAFVDFTRSSAGLNPGFAQMQWLIRLLETTREDQGAAGAIATLEKLVGGAGQLRAHWESGSDPGLGGEPFPSAIEHPQAAYAVGSGARPRVLIVNETSKLPFNRWHLGCDLVSRTLVEGLRAQGLECVGWTNSLAGLNRILEHDPEARFEAVVINGEGTMHDNADRAFEIASIGRYLQDLGKRVFLINTVWQDNGARLDALVRGFDLVAVRESVSAEALARVRPDVRLVPDLCWSAEIARPAQRGTSIAVLDCVEPGTTARLADIARAAGLPLFVMDRFFEAFHRAVRGGCTAEQAPRVLRRDDVGAPAGWIGGRFHGVVLALGAGIPILSTPSNTRKVEAMLADIGLDDKLLAPSTLDRLRRRDQLSELFAGPAGFGAADWRKVDDYKRRARLETGRLFAEIAACLA
jgi:hypothetical protein